MRSAVLERNETTTAHSKAAGIHVRTREVLRRWGAEGPFLAAGELVDRLALHDADGGGRLLDLDLEALADEAAEPALLVLEQRETERLLLAAVRSSGLCDVRFGAEVRRLVVTGGGVRLEVKQATGPEVVDAEFVVGADGAGSCVRDALGLPFGGSTYRLRPMLADVLVDDARDELPWPRVANTSEGMTVGIRLRPGSWRVIGLGGSGPGSVSSDDDEVEVPDGEIRRRAEQVLGPGPLRTAWASRFRIHRRSAPTFRLGRVLLAGDAAHVHSPVGGQGMNAGIQDADNLAWKLAATLRGGDVERLLRSYDVERRAVVAGTVTWTTDVVTRLFLQAPVPVRLAAFAASRGLMGVARLRHRALRRLTMIDLDLPASPLLDGGELAAGKRLPDPLLTAPDGRQVRLYGLLPPGATLLEVAGDAEAGDPPHRLPADLPVDAVLRIGRAGYRDPGGALVSLLGGRPGWILVRPDAHVAWARTDPEGLRDATRRALGLTGGVRPAVVGVRRQGLW